MWDPEGHEKSFMRWLPEGMETCGQVRVFWLSGGSGEASVAFS